MDEEQVLFENQRDELKKKIQDREYEGVFNSLVCQQEKLIERRVRASEKCMEQFNMATIRSSSREEKEKKEKMAKFNEDCKSYERLADGTRRSVKKILNEIYSVNTSGKPDKRLQNLLDLRRSKGFKVQYGENKLKYHDTQDSSERISNNYDSKRQSTGSNIEFKRASVI